MKKSILILFFGLFTFGMAQAQIGQAPNGNVPDHTPMMNKTWEAIDKMMYKVTYSGNKKVYTPSYPPVLKSLENKVVELPGYLIPLNSGRTHKTFMISVLPVMQCMFCGSNGIPPMVEIFMKGDAVKYTEEPIKIKGTMKFNPEPLKGNSEIQLVDAVLVK